MLMLWTVWSSVARMCGGTYCAADDGDLVYFACGFLVEQFFEDVFAYSADAGNGKIPVGGFGHDGLKPRGRPRGNEE